MARFSTVFVVFAVLALLTGSVQCASACTPAAAGHPSCPHHKPAKQDSNCAHELVAASPAQTLFAVASAADEGSALRPFAWTSAPQDAPQFVDSPPPDPPASSPIALRI